MRRSHQTRQAFTLVEIIVSLSVMVLVILASTNLLVSIIRSNTENVDTLVAYGLSQEGLEAVRNIRDSNWLLGADFQGTVGGKCLWPSGQCLPVALGSKKVFSLLAKPVQISRGATVTSDQIPTYAPWELKDVTPSRANDPVDPAYTQLYIVKSQNASDVWYQPCFSSCGSADVKSIFQRYIEIEPLDYVNAPGKVKKYRVSSVVQWNELGRPKEVRLTTELTDWKGGPL